CVLGTTGGEILPEPLAGRGIEGRMRSEIRVRARIAGQDGELDSLSAAGRLGFGKPVSPILSAAEKPGDHQLRMPERLLHIEIDRSIVLKLEKIGEPECQLRIASIPSSRQRRELAVGCRE